MTGVQTCALPIFSSHSSCASKIWNENYNLTYENRNLHFLVNHIGISSYPLLPKWSMLGSKELGTNVFELQFVMLANHDQNV